MSTTQELRAAIAKLPLDEREALAKSIEQSIDDEYDRLAEASITVDMGTVERILAKHLLPGEQMHELLARLDAADRETPDYSPWVQIGQEIFAELHLNQ
jgi:2-iminoacetate synthase ThiH